MVKRIYERMLTIQGHACVNISHDIPHSAAEQAKLFHKRRFIITKQGQFIYMAPFKVLTKRVCTATLKLQEFTLVGILTVISKGCHS